MEKKKKIDGLELLTAGRLLNRVIPCRLVLEIVKADASKIKRSISIRRFEAIRTHDSRVYPVNLNPQSPETDLQFYLLFTNLLGWFI